MVVKLLSVGSSFNSEELAEELREWTETLSFLREVTVTVVTIRIEWFKLFFVLSLAVLSLRLGTVGGEPVLVLLLRTVAAHSETR